jgi:hypothetical protein
LLFWTVKVSVVAPFSGIEGAPNAFISTGGPTTASDAVAVLPVPAFAEVTVTLLFFTPAVVPVTLTETVHEAPAASVPPDKLTEDDPATAVAVPPQVLVRLGGVATTRPAGKLSVNAIPVRVNAAFGFWMLKLRLVVPFSRMLAAPKALAITSGLPTVRLAVAVLPVPPLVEVTLPVVLVYWPETAPVTVTENWHWLLGAMVAPDKAMLVGLVVVKVPPHTVVDALATVSPVGSVSLNATPVSATALAAGLVMVKVNEVVAFSAIVEGLNILAIEGGATTLMLAEAVPPVPPSVEVTFPVVLFFCPAVVPVTFTEKVHELLAARVAPDRLMTPVPAVAVIVPPPQEPVSPLGVEITSPAGKVSLKPIPVSAAVGLLF